MLIGHLLRLVALWLVIGPNLLSPDFAYLLFVLCGVGVIGLFVCFVFLLFFLLLCLFLFCFFFFVFCLLMFLFLFYLFHSVTRISVACCVDINFSLL